MEVKQRKSFKKPLLYLCAAFLIFIVPIFVQFRALPSPVPQIIKSTLQHQIIVNPQVIYFWAEWCGICRAMQGSISGIVADYKVVTLAVTSGEAAQIQTYLQEHQLNWPVINDPNNEIASQFSVQAVPATFILNKKGEIIFSETGYISEYGLRIRLWLATSTSFKKISIF
jgi:thiol-disulfide isomerase/thioredoxin